MTCRQFEDAMEAEFGLADADRWKDLLIREKWDHLPVSEHRDHLAACSECAHSLFQFFQIRHVVEYLRHPCFHVAYYSADVPERCIDRTLGLYSIITSRERGEGIVIGFCPWCGVGLPTGV